MTIKNIRLYFALAFIIIVFSTSAQPYKTKYKWTKDGNSYYTIDNKQIVKVTLPDQGKSIILSAAQLTPKDSSKPLSVEDFSLSEDEKKILIYTHSQKVWRYKTRGDYWLYNNETKSLFQLGKGLPTASLMFAKLSPDGTKVAYSSKHNM